MSPTREFCLSWLKRNGWTLDAEWPSGRVSISKGEKVYRAKSMQTAYAALRYNLRRWVDGMPADLRAQARILMARAATDEIIQAMAQRQGAA